MVSLPIIKSPKPTPNTLGASSLWSYHKAFHYIWFMGRDLSGLPDIEAFNVVIGAGTSPSVLLNASSHKKHIVYGWESE